jgi:predicted dehydrogenase
VSTTDVARVGVVGCGVVAHRYVEGSAAFDTFDVVACADLDGALAHAFGQAHGLEPEPVEALVASPELDVVLNLTPANAHAAVSSAALEAGKHVYTEKPLATSLADATALVAEAERRGVRIGCAPDTFLGGGHQTARALIDQGVIGQAVGGTATFMCPGHERWHPNPAFYYEVGGGPMLDMGPYYITDLVNLLGPVAQVAGFAVTPRKERIITSEARNGERIPVYVPTHVAGVMAFANGAVVQIAMSFDVAGHKHVPIEVYGTEGTLIVPDPNRFAGPVEYLKKGGQFENCEVTAPYADGNYRSLGVADLAHAIRSKRPHRANGSLALHVLEVMEAFHTAAETGRTVTITTATERPAPLSESLVDGQLGK